MQSRLLTDALRTLQRKFAFESGFTSEEFVRQINDVLDLYPTTYFVNSRDRSKRVSGFGVSKNPDKVIIRYIDRRNSTVLIRNLQFNVIAIEADVWDEPSEEAEEDFLLQRLGIRV
jgi:hypothetical protein